MLELRLHSLQGSLWTPPSPRHRPGAGDGEATSRLATDHMQGAETRAKAQQELTRRLIISDWVQQNLGLRLPTAADADFRAALQDGVLLCKLLNIVRPGSIRKVRLGCGGQHG